MLISITKKKEKKNKMKEKNEITVIWLYPDILNNYGDRGNIEAIKYIANKKDIKVNLIKVHKYDDPIPFEKGDLILLGAGEFRVMPKIIERLKKDIDKLKEYIESNKYIFVFNVTASIFAKETIRRNGKNIKGLNLLPLTVKEKRYNYGDDLYLSIYNGMDIIGSQIQMADYILEDGKYFGDVHYGYGNDFYSKKAGARYKNLIFPNIQGPLFFKNPWYLEFILEDIISGFKDSNEVIKDFNLNNYITTYPYEVKAFEAAKKFINEKPAASKHDYTNEYLL